MKSVQVILVVLGMALVFWNVYTASRQSEVSKQYMELEQQYMQREKDLEVATRSISKIQSKHRKLKKEHGKVQEQLQVLQADTDDEKMKVLEKQQALSDKNDELEEAATKCKAEAAQTKEEHQATTKKLEETEEKVAEKEKVVNKLKEVLATKEELVAKLQKRRDSLKEQVKKLKKKLEAQDEGKNKGKKDSKDSEDEEDEDAKDDEANQTSSEAAKKSTKAKKMVVAMGLYGSDLKYTQGAVENVKIAKESWPGWTVRFYVDNSVPADKINELKSYDNVEIVDAASNIQGGIAGMFWRFLVAQDPDVDVYIVRDSDSRLGAREKAAIDEWLATEKNAGFHVMRDHPSHKAYSMSGGMWGGRERIPDMMDLINKWNNKQDYVADMHFLNLNIWPRIKDNVVQHDSFSCVQWGGRPFPTIRKGTEHVGQVFDFQNNPRQVDIPLLEQALPEPIECQPEAQKKQA